MNFEDLKFEDEELFKDKEKTIKIKRRCAYVNLNGYFLCIVDQIYFFTVLNKSDKKILYTFPLGKSALCLSKEDLISYLTQLLS